MDTTTEGSIQISEVFKTLLNLFSLYREYFHEPSCITDGNIISGHLSTDSLSIPDNSDNIPFKESWYSLFSNLLVY